MPETALRIARHAREWGRRSGRTCPCACTSWLRTQPEIRTCHTDKCARKGSVQTTVFISRGRNGGAGREGARVPLGVKWWGWGWSRFRLYDSSEVPCARAARGASRKLPTANPHQCSVTIVRSKFIIPVRSGGRCAGAAAGGGRRSPCACTYTAGGRAGMANALRGIVPRPPGGVQGTYTVLWSKERIKHPGARGKTLVKALEPPTPQHPPAPLTRLPNTIPP